MDVLFETRMLWAELSSHSNCQKSYGAEGAKKIALRLQQMVAAPSLRDLRHLPGHCHELHGDLAGYLAVDVLQLHQMVFRPTQSPPPTSRSGALDWSEVTSVTITEIRIAAKDRTERKR